MLISKKEYYELLIMKYSLHLQIILTKIIVLVETYKLLFWKSLDSIYELSQTVVQEILKLIERRYNLRKNIRKVIQNMALNPWPIYLQTVRS